MPRLLRWLWVSLQRWLYKKPEGFFAYTRLILCAFAINILWLATILNLENRSPAYFDWQRLNGFEILYLGLHAFIEELLFRWSPIFLLIILSGRKPVPLLLLASLASSVYFGFAHGLNWHCLYLQGVAGFIFSLVFIKCSSPNSRRIFLLNNKAILVTTIIHALYNLTLVSFGIA